MNKDRRAQLDKARTLIEEAQIIIQDVAESERGAFENLSEGLQASSRGSRMDEISTLLEDLADTLSDATGICEDAQN